MCVHPWGEVDVQVLPSSGRVLFIPPMTRIPVLTQILCPVDRKHLCSPKPKLTTGEMFLLMSLGDGCLALVLLSPVLVDRAALLNMAADSTANQQAAQLAVLLMWVFGGFPATRQRGGGLNHQCHLFHFGRWQAWSRSQDPFPGRSRVKHEAPTSAGTPVCIGISKLTICL